MIQLLSRSILLKNSYEAVCSEQAAYARLAESVVETVKGWQWCVLARDLAMAVLRKFLEHKSVGQGREWVCSHKFKFKNKRCFYQRGCRGS